MNPRIRTFEVSATRGDGLDAWYGWLRERAAQAHRVGGG
jgi:hydrogenase nickel incorporation protein HypB